MSHKMQLLTTVCQVHIIEAICRANSYPEMSTIEQVHFNSLYRKCSNASYCWYFDEVGHAAYNH